MKLRLALTAAAGVSALLIGCATPPPDNLEHGPHNTVAYDVAIDATAPGAQIEANGQVIGQTPLHLKIFGDKDGTFHDFGSYYYVVRALPVTTNQFLQTRVFQTGRYFTPEDQIPQQIFFDMNQPPPAPSAVPPAVAGYPAYPYPAPYPYYYPAPYYGPTVRFYFGGPGYYHHHW